MTNLIQPVYLLAQNAPSGGSGMVGLPDAPSGGAATVQAPGGAPAGGAAPSSPLNGQFMILMAVMLGLMIFMSFWTNRKEQKKRQALMSAMKKGDRVQTLGGVIGTVHEVYDTEVVLRLEEGRVRVSRASVQTILKPSGSRADEKVPEIEVKNSREKAAV